jgi:hypothetical protein
VSEDHNVEEIFDSNCKIDDGIVSCGSETYELRIEADQEQYALIDSALAWVVEASKAESASFGLYLACLHYLAKRDLYEPEVEESKAVGGLSGRQWTLQMHQKYIVEEALRSAFGSGCLSPGHAVAHIANTFRFETPEPFDDRVEKL